MSERAAFTYTELIVVIAIVAILSLVALATSDAAATEQGRLAAEMFAADVEYARSLAIARPDDPIVIKVYATGNEYWLARAATPDTPITHPTTHQPYVVSFGPTGNAGLKSVQLIAYDLGGDSILGFNSLGTTDQTTAAVLQVSSAGQKYEVTVQPVGAKTTVTKGLTKVLATVAEAVPVGLGSPADPNSGVAAATTTATTTALAVVAPTSTSH
ncbi:MAG TPA: prepilin-type N-terminal cleavage/methylation domain-containing protein [Phycisphaerae bacterium]|nr:prepilin-type N-terminal cleavage/methylation domain-containing protein [Phycisphaerae bacterium]